MCVWPSWPLEREPVNVNSKAFVRHALVDSLARVALTM